MPTNHRHVPAAQAPHSHAGALPATPDIATIEGEYTAPPGMITEQTPVLVQHNGPISSRALPTRAGSPSTVIVGTSGDQVMGKDLTRARLTLIATDNPFYYASRPVSSWSTASAALWPINVPLVLLHGDAVYCACATADMSSTIAVIPETMDGS